MRQHGSGKTTVRPTDSDVVALGISGMVGLKKMCILCYIKRSGKESESGSRGARFTLAYYLDMPEKGAVNQSTSGASATNSRLLLTLVYTHLSVFTILAQWD